MKKMYLLVFCLLISVTIIGCTADKKDIKSVEAGSLILNQDQIGSVEVVKGSNEELIVHLDASDISSLLRKVKQIPVKKLTKDQDNNFMSGRMKDETKLNINFFGEDTTNSLNGEFIIWPDGYIYFVDIDSMKKSQRTISYLSESKYPEIYEWLNEI